MGTYENVIPGTDMEALESMIEQFGTVSLLSEIPGLLMSLAAYIIMAVALYTIAKRRGINKPWLAWIPIGNAWIVGCISDQYQYLVNGAEKKRRRVLMVLELVMVLAAIFVVLLFVSMLFSLLSGGIANLENLSTEYLIEHMLTPMTGILLLAFPMMIMAVVYIVFFYMALYDIFKSCDPANAVLYLVLYIVLGMFISIAPPILLLICRNKDLGMPPREPVYQPPTWQSTWQTPEEPWENQNNE